MVTIAHLTKKILQEKPFIHESLEKGLINIMALSEMIQPTIEKEIGKVKTSAIGMAIRRYMEEQDKALYKKIKLSSTPNLQIKSDLFEISLVKSPGINKKLMNFYNIIDLDSGDTLNIIQGNYEILIISNAMYKKEFKKSLKGEKIKNIREDISSLSIKIPSENLNTPGFYYVITKSLTMENIPIIDIVNTETEATFILLDKHISKAYDILKREISIEYYKK